MTGPAPETRDTAFGDEARYGGAGLLNRSVRAFRVSLWPWLIVSTLVYLFFVVPMLGRPLTLDQAFPTAWNAGAIAVNGFAALGDPAGNYEISHTLLHQHLLALFIQAFGETTEVMRSFGAVCFVIALVLIARICVVLFGAERGVVVGGIASLLYATNPFTVQQSVMVDQETTVLPVALLLVAYAICRSTHERSVSNITTLAALFALAIWAKELPPFFVIAGYFCFLVLHRGPVHAVILTGSVGALGLGMFVLTWGGYCLFTGVPVLSFFQFSITNKLLTGSALGASSPLRIVSAFEDLLTMVTHAFYLALGIALVMRLRRLLLLPGGRIEQSDFLWCVVGVYWLATNIVFYTFPRYQYPLYAFAVILVAYEIRGLLRSERTERIAVGVLVSGAVALLLMLVAPQIHVATMLALFMPWVVVPVIALALVALLLHQTGSGRAGGFLLYFMLSTALGVGLQQRSGTFTTAEIWNEYGEVGFEPALAYVIEHRQEGLPVLRKDLGYYLQIADPERSQNWIYNSIFRNSSDAEQVRALIRDPDVTMIVVDQFARTDWSRDILMEEFELTQTFGDFEIFERASTSRQ